MMLHNSVNSCPAFLSHRGRPRNSSLSHTLKVSRVQITKLKIRGASRRASPMLSKHSLRLPLNTQWCGSFLTLFATSGREFFLTLFATSGREFFDTFCHFRAGGATPARLEIQGVPPVAVEALLDYCYKDKSVFIVPFIMVMVFGIIATLVSSCVQCFHRTQDTIEKHNLECRIYIVDVAFDTVHLTPTPFT